MSDCPLCGAVASGATMPNHTPPCAECLSRGVYTLVTPSDRVCRRCGSEPGEQFTRRELVAVLRSERKQ